MKYEFKVIDRAASATFEDDMSKMGAEGWELVSVDGGKAFFQKVVGEEVPSGVARACGNCKNHDTPVAEKDLTAETPVWCGVHKVAMCPTGTCKKFVLKDGIPGAIHALPAGAVPDVDSAWHWQPQTEMGQKRVEAVSSYDTGLNSPIHAHRVLAVVAKDGAVIRGKTDMVNGHDHLISVIGLVDEADGHTHTWAVHTGAAAATNAVVRPGV